MSLNTLAEGDEKSNDFAGPQNAAPLRMQSRSWELQERATRFSTSVVRLCEQLTPAASSKRIVRNLINASSAMRIGYRDACSSSSPEQFLSRISAVARHAKRARTCLVLLVELNHISIDAAREVILDGRGLEAIFTASRNTAKRRARKRMVSRRNPSERAARASDGKTPRKRQNPPGVT